MGRIHTLAIVLGIRPDIIRTSIVLDLLRSSETCDLKFFWSGQHYSENLKDVFFRELKIKPPDIELNASGETDAEIISKLILKLYGALEELQPEAVVLVGDTNTVMGCLAAAQLNIPIVHIEGCMRSYDWRMPEEKYRVVIDHLSDVIYAYLDEYKQQGINEGLNPANIIVTGNPIVDVLNKYYYGRKNYYQDLATDQFFRKRRIERAQYYLMTCHRRENVHDRRSLENILSLVGGTDRKVYFPASYRTQGVLKTHGLRLPTNVIMTDPIGYEEFLVLMSHARGVISDSGTVVEEACVLQVPSIQIRMSTERPQVYDVGACVKFDPTKPESYPPSLVLGKLESLLGTSWPNPLGDGKASERIANDILKRLEEGQFMSHKQADYHLDIRRSYREDGIENR